MPLHFKGISEYKKTFKDRVATRSRSASPQRRMRLAGLRSDQMGISREPQFLSKRKVPSSHTPQVSSSFQWNPTTTEPPQRRDETPRPGTSPLAPTPERVHTPLAPRGPPPPGDPQRGPTTLQGQTHTRSPLATVGKQDQAFNGADYVLRRKAGLKSSGQRTGLQNSEYRKQFPWKTPVAGHASPLLAAEQMLYTSHRSIPPFKSNPVVVLESEYSRNFKASPPPRGPRLRSDVDQVPLFQRENVSPFTSKSKWKKKREERKSSIAEENIPLPQPREQLADQEVKSQSPQKAHLPHSRREVSVVITVSTTVGEEVSVVITVSTTVGEEVSVVITVSTTVGEEVSVVITVSTTVGEEVSVVITVSTTVGEEVSVVITVSTTVGEEGRDSQHSHVWYHEVRELRKKAEAYRQRAWGTHFSRLHLNQILSDQNQLWEASTPSSSNLSSGTGSGDGEEDRSPTSQALELARVDSSSSSVVGPPPLTPVSSRRSSTRGAGDTADPPGHPNPGALNLPVQRRLAWEEETGAGGGTGEEREEEEDKERKDERKERKDELRVLDHRSLSVAGSHRSREGGRMPTPTLQRIATVQRTHHDLTTPATGGAILVSPPKMEANGWAKRSEPPLGKTRSPFKPLSLASPQRAARQNEERNQPQSSPAAGVTTVDPLPLREDSWSGETSPENPPDPPPEAKPSRKRTTSGQPNARIQGTLRDPEFQHNGNLGLRTSELLLCPGGGCGTDDEDDRMSQISSRSAASCSMASQVLDRAQRRKDHFWGKR
ncbi:nuclear protein MDM1 [Oncorhynchus tshawytscha]|uniref:nuclear protein MDM1 n=1 Tax=Oncorhynchus tshawytscha TaxID=74940 RepID=UPI001C3E1394|nr:nuclear protein MDM1 [Oncorhynchus tshawytscha]